MNDRDVVLCDDVLTPGARPEPPLKRCSAAAARARYSSRCWSTEATETAYPRGLCRQEHPHLARELIEVRLPEFDGETGVYLMAIDDN